MEREPAVAWLLALALAACAAPAPRSPALLLEAPALVPTLGTPDGFLLRQHVEFSAGERSGSFEAVVERRCDELVVVGFTPFGTRAFSIRQRGTQVGTEILVPGSWPFPPEYILLDVHRAYLVPLPEISPSGGFPETRYGAEQVTETWEAGRLVERRFRRADGHRPSVVVRYVGGETHERVARAVRIENEEFGYVLEITTLVRSALECP